MKRRFLSLLSLLLLAPALAAFADPDGVRVPPSLKPVPEPMGREAARRLPPAPGVPFFVSVAGLDVLPLEGAPRDSFLAAFRGTFSESQLATERDAARSGEVVPSLPLSNRFRLLEGDAEGFDDVWRAEVGLDSARVGRALVTWWAITPEAADVVRIAPDRTWLEADPPGWSRLGRAAAVLVLERLHHTAGELDQDVRLRHDGVRRSEAKRPAGRGPRR